LAVKKHRTQHYTGLALPCTKEPELAFRHVNMTKMHLLAAGAVLIKLLKNIGMSVEVGIDVAVHRLKLSFKLGDSVNGLSEKVLKFLVGHHN
jgi:hypothetical protein